ncbi:helix-turn-helix transcriptional regulator [Streptomyces castrisilvae]|uniref:Helix-turn-helix transcriptional regulator n=1 Tax=Streptomyces castrisilvae TaxID=3033811 RepID=A0ABY9HDT4_9ACTN|nr:helix-turn-helix transcriptional regulator [Streptomyces sp. Mut1]WLQ32676.1 helix-turn-helix transcriptional regulator [Streptomyces sp. Mut1]
MQVAVERAIATMWDRYEEPLSLDEIANTAILSKFYFSRVFRNLTGTSPGRFLSVVRLHQAKSLLLETDLSVTEISYRVGYNSLGTFTSRFTRSVSHSPARYRALARAGLLAPSGGSATGPQQLLDGGRPTSVLEGTIRLPGTAQPVRIYVGAFRESIVQGRPTACAILDGPGSFSLRLPEGAWYIRAAVLAMDDPPSPLGQRRPLLVASSQLLNVRRDQDTRVDLTGRPLTPLDLPILLALPELDFSGLPKAGGAPFELPAITGT